MPSRIYKNTEQQNAAIVKSFFSNNYQNFPAYQSVKKAYGIDIRKQSKLNIQHLIALLRNPDYLPDFEQADYQGVTFTQQELTLFHTWKDFIAPTFTLKHAAQENINFDILGPIGKRERILNQTVNNSNTGTDPLKENSFWVLAPGTEHQTPSFLGKDVCTVTIHLNRMQPEEQKDILGLWVSGHLQEYYVNDLNGLKLGSTKRHITFNSKNLTKTYHYQRADGTTVTRTVNYRDELFAADKNLNAIFDGLFYMLLLDLRCIGGEFKDCIYSNASNPKLLLQAYEILFQSWVFPEAKLPKLLHLQKPYIEITHKDPQYQSKLAQMVEAIKSSDINKLQACLDEDISIDITNSEHDTPILIAMNGNKKMVKPIIERGANLAWRNKLRQNAFDRAIEQRFDDIVENILNQGAFITQLGDSNINVYQQFNLNIPDFDGIPKIFSSIFSNGNTKLIDLLLEQDITITSKMPLIARLYPNIKEEKYLKFFKEKGIDANTPLANGKNVLMLAAERGDLDFIKLLTTLFDLKLDIKYYPNSATIADDEENTALHFAIQNGHFDVASWLIEQGANAKLRNFRGLTAYGLLLQILNQGFEGYLKRIDFENKQAIDMDAYKYVYRGIDITKFAEQHYKEQLEFKKSIWGKQEQRLQSIKTHLERKGLAAEDNTSITDDRHLCTQRKQSTIAIVSCLVANKTYFLFVRKRDPKGKPLGFFLAPGGDYNRNLDLNFASAAAREANEETGLNLMDITPKQLFKYECLDKSAKITLVQTHFYYFNLGSLSALPAISAQSDVADVAWIAWDMVNVSNNIFTFNGVRIQQSNSLLVEAINNTSLIDTQAVNAALTIEHFGARLLIEAIKNSDYAKIGQLYDLGLDFTKTDGLFVACEKEDKQAIDLLISYGANINQIFKNVTALIYLVTLGNTDMAKYLIEKHNANINIQIGATSVISISCYIGDKEFVKYLLSRGIDLSQGLGGTALLNAIARLNIEIIEMLLDYDKEKKFINLNQTYAYGMSTYDINQYLPLFFAINIALKMSHLNDKVKEIPFTIIECLISKGANPQTHLSNNETIIEFLTWQQAQLTKSQGIIEHLKKQIEDKQQGKGMSFISLENLQTELGYHQREHNQLPLINKILETLQANVEQVEKLARPQFKM